MDRDLDCHMDVATARPEVPAVGTGLALQPFGAGGVVAIAELAAWSDGVAGAVATARVATTPEVARALNGMSLWATGRTSQTDALVLFEAVAAQVAVDQLELTGVRRLASEHRRSVVRAALDLPVELVDSTGAEHRSHTLDLSRSGCRMALDPTASLAVDSSVEILIMLSPDAQVRTEGQVLRVDRDAGHAVIRFLDVKPTDAGRIDRTVYAELSRVGAGVE